MVADNESVVPFTQKDGETFKWYTENVWPTPIFSALKIQCRDTSAYPEQIRVMKRFIADLEDEYNKHMRDKYGQSERDIERIDAHLCFTISGMVRAFNAELNMVNSIHKRFPILIQNRNRRMKKLDG